LCIGFEVRIVELPHQNGLYSENLIPNMWWS